MCVYVFLDVWERAHQRSKLDVSYLIIGEFEALMVLNKPV